MIRLTETLKRRMPILFALAMGALAVGIMNSWVQGERRKLEAARRKLLEDYRTPIEVVVASKDVHQGVLLDASHLATAAVPEKFAQPYAARSPRDVIGLVTIAPLAEGEQVLLNKVRRPEEVPTGTSLSSLTPEGKRAVTIGVDAVTGVGGFVRPGDNVDVLWNFQLPQVGGQQAQIVTLTLFQDIQVLAVGGQVVGGGGLQPESQQQQQRDYTVTLALDPQEISFLLFAREQGRIQLSLRPQHEGKSQAAVAPTNINTMLEAKLGIKTTAPPQKHARQVEVFKGLQRDVVLLPEEEQ